MFNPNQEPESFFALPGYIDQIVELVSGRDWLVHNFKTNNPEQIYNPCNYAHNKIYKGTKYTAVLDLNIFQFLINSLLKRKPHNYYRNAIAFLVFCQVSDIELDPTYAVYEKINYDGANLEEALSSLQLFHNINNTNTDILASYALGFAETFPVGLGTQIDRKSLGVELVKYRRLIDWDSLYLIVLAITDLQHDRRISSNRKLIAFIKWLIKEFRLSLPAIIYAVKLFGKSPLKNMMKFKPSQSNQKRRKAVFNMTWDLYLMNRFFQIWIKNDGTQEFLFASDDKAFCSLLKLSVDVEKDLCLKPIQSLLDDKVFREVDELLAYSNDDPDRVYNSESWGPEHRAELIQRYEEKLLC